MFVLYCHTRKVDEGSYSLTSFYWMISLGVFLCLDCSATHRSMGVHTTFVRSVDLDEWTQRQIGMSCLIES